MTTSGRPPRKRGQSLLIADVPFSNDPSSSVAIIGDKSCIYCGTSLRGLTAQDLCPECGKLAGYSLLGDNLRDVDSGWIRRVMMGINLVSGAFVLLALYTAFTLLPQFGVKETDFDASLIRFCLSVGGRMLFVVGVFMVTLPETSGSLIARKRGVAETLRWSTVLTAAMAFTPEHWLEQLPANQMLAFITVFSVTSILLQSLLWMHLRTIISRTPRREVWRILNVMIWVSLVLFVAVSRLALHGLMKHFPNDAAQFGVHVSAAALIIVHHLVAIYPLQLARKAILRTVGYWDS